MISPTASVTAGSLLVATARLGDPHFRRTVVYVIAHNAQGTIGVVINRRSDIAVQTVLPTWAPHASRPPVVYLGGPVQIDAAMAVGVLKSSDRSELPDFARPVAGQVVLVHLDADPEVVRAQVRGLRVFVGHAGWGEGQLDDEIAEHAWTVLPGLPDDVLAGPKVDLWFRVLRRQGWPDALAAYHPGDLRRN